MRQIGFVFIQGFADWEFGHLAGSLAEWFDGKAVALTPHGQPVVSFGGLSLDGQRGLSAEENQDLDAVAVIGSDAWSGASPPDLALLLSAVSGRGGVVGGICAGALALVRAGLFADHAHTSNGRDWIQELVPGYTGAEHYRDVPHAVIDNHIVSAPGSAPGTPRAGLPPRPLSRRGRRAGPDAALYGSRVSGYPKGRPAAPPRAPRDGQLRVRVLAHRVLQS